MDLVRLAYYPFLPEVREAVREAGPDMDAVLNSRQYDGVRRRAMQRVEGALGSGFPAAQVMDERTGLLELLSIPVARMLIVAMGEKAVVPRYAAAEARLVHDRIVADADDEAVTQSCLALGIPADLGDGVWRLHFSAYIRLAPVQLPEWKLIRRPVAAGNVWLDRSDMARLIEEALKRRIADDLETERTKLLPDAVKAVLAPMLEALAPKLEEARDAWSQGDFGPVQPELFPPCIKEIFESLKRSENVPHHGRFAFATFLHTVGWSSEQILDYLSSTPNFDREKSRYQIEHVSGGKSVQAYTPPGCGTMQTNGVCPLAKRDGLCFKIKHPLSYYRAQLKFRTRDEEKAAGLLHPQITQSPALSSVKSVDNPTEVPRG